MVWTSIGESPTNGMWDPNLLNRSAESYYALIWKIKDPRPILALTQAWCNTPGIMKGRAVWAGGAYIEFEYQDDADAYSAFESLVILQGNFPEYITAQYNYLEESMDLYRNSLNESH